ncbi:hypothetical protein [Polaribacter sp. Hel_I_88]|uniref:hypothetical protein n=1 Tax=Polaribacter sp. Hel_I_88 TaxID=1250006 RepID=UPI00047C82F5|nr:hypothetical protein [Polaribacter sp. Hel_I_88]
MKTNVIILLLLAPMLVLAQIKGKNSKDPYTSENGTIFKKGDKITLASASKDNSFAYVYKFKNSFSVGNIMKTVKNVNDVANLNVKSTQGIKNAINTTKSVAGNDLLKTSVSNLQNKVVSEKYIEENALATDFSGKTYTIKSFKVFTDDETGKQIVHAIAKGKGGKIAILIDAAQKNGEI